MRTVECDRLTCTCGHVNPRYISTCVCGCSRFAMRWQTPDSAEEKREQERLEKFNTISARLDVLQKLKELLDMGIITQSEYDYEKAELLKI